MAHPTGTPSRNQRLITAGATLLLGVTTALALGRVFLGGQATWKLLWVALASGLLACAMERRNLLIATVVSAGAMVVVVSWLVFPSTLWHVLPGTETLGAIARASTLVGRQARLYVAPAAPLAPLMLAATTATWAAVFSAHALAFRAGSPLLALLPPVALVAFADTVLDSSVRPLFGLGFLIAALAVIFADGVRRVEGWGPVWAGVRRPARLSATVGRGARRVALGAVGLALLAPIFIPGFGSKAIFDLRTADHPVSIDLLVSVANDLHRADPVNVFTVKARQPSYYRLAALIQFDGAGWSQDALPVFSDLRSGVPLPQTASLSPALVTDTTPVVQEFHLSSELSTSWLPVAATPVSVQLSEAGQWDATTGGVHLAHPPDEGLSYQVTSLEIAPTPEQLRAVVFPQTPDATYTQLPVGLSTQVQALAKRWTAHARTVYDAVMAIQRHLTGPRYTYNINAPRRQDATALADFLLDHRQGFCQQFATAMAALLRELGIPTRVAVGFTTGAETNPSSGTYQVTTNDAHTWPEVLFPGYGWLAFEPTPGASNPVASPYLAPATTGPRCEHPGSCQGPGDGGKPRGIKQGDPVPIKRQLRRHGVTSSQTAQRAPAHTSARTLLLLGMGIGAAVFLSMPLLRAWRRRRRIRRAAGEPRRLILATYDVFTERAGELGFHRTPGETVQEYRRRLVGTASGRGEDLDTLCRMTALAAYAPEEPRTDDARAAIEAARSTLQRLRRATPLDRRVMGRYRRDV